MEKDLEKELRKNKLMREKAAVAEQVISQLREQTEMLAGQLQLGDERYADLRSRLLIERHNKKQEKQKLMAMMRERDEREKELIIMQDEMKRKAVSRPPPSSQRHRMQQQEQQEQQQQQLLLLQQQGRAAGGGGGGGSGLLSSQSLPSLTRSPHSHVSLDVSPHKKNRGGSKGKGRGKGTGHHHHHKMHAGDNHLVTHKTIMKVNGKEVELPVSERAAKLRRRQMNYKPTDLSADELIPELRFTAEMPSRSELRSLIQASDRLEEEWRKWE